MFGDFVVYLNVVHIEHCNRGQHLPKAIITGEHHESSSDRQELTLTFEYVLFYISLQNCIFGQMYFGKLTFYMSSTSYTII